jgi:hypothetical protein
LLGQEHAFVNECFVGKTGDVPITGLEQFQLRDDAHRALADNVEFAFESHVVFQRAAPGDEDLADKRLGRFGGGAQRGIVGGDRAPADDFQAFLFDDFLKCPFASLAFGRVLRQENEAGAVLAGLGQLETAPFALLLKESMGHLDQDARAVAGVGFATARAAMVEVAEHLEGLLDDLMRFPAFDIHHETDAAGFVFEPGVIEALPGGHPV